MWEMTDARRVAEGEDFFMKAFELFQQDRFGEAAAAYTEAIRVEPENLDAYFNRALTYILLGQAKPAMNDLNRVISSKPNDRHAYFAMSEAYSLINDREKAFEWYERGINIRPDIGGAVSRLDALFSELENRGKD
jgi:tetratricopeptide (TPR) repeat protein